MHQDPQTANDRDTPRLDRREALGCLAWSGAAMIWTLTGGIPRTVGIAGQAAAAETAAGAFTFAQISDTHIGFAKDANPDMAGTLNQAIDLLNAMENRPAFLAHTGDITHLSKPEEFDKADQLLKRVKVERTFFIPGEHDALDDGLAGYLRRHGGGAEGGGYYSFDYGGAHFAALVNVVDFKPGSLTSLGDTQLAWLERDLAGLSSSTPVVVLAHIPLWSIYPAWGWATADAERALALLRRFGSVTVLNGHIHQVMQKIEGTIAFHTAMSTAYPQPRPGEAAAPGPLKLPAARLGKALGIRTVEFVPNARVLAAVDTPLDRTS